MRMSQVVSCSDLNLYILSMQIQSSMTTMRNMKLINAQHEINEIILQGFSSLLLISWKSRNRWLKVCQSM